MNLIELLEKGGIAILLLAGLSILSLSVTIERLWFWSRVLTRETQIVKQVLEAACYDWTEATNTARRYKQQPIGRLLYAPLRLTNPEPEVFRLALEAAADEELTAMRRGEKVLEGVITLAPLLGLLGTVLGLMRSLGNIRLGDLGTASTAGVTLGIRDALLSTAIGLIVAIVSSLFYRLFRIFLETQVKIFRRSGSELELLYRQAWAMAYNKQPAARSTNSPIIPPDPLPPDSDLQIPPL
ncbi:MAG: MotA/TolQ/ExbB proton channel family protein [Prochlorothrix sp.]|nr:MotA/TolQ/ExbB proton channel family protein [Prochlorothrix sp.]